MFFPPSLPLEAFFWSLLKDDWMVEESSLFDSSRAPHPRCWQLAHVQADQGSAGDQHLQGAFLPL